MVGVEVVEGILETLLFQQLLLVAGRHQEFGEVDMPWAVGVDELENLLYFVLSKPRGGVGVENLYELALLYDSVPIPIDFFEDFHEVVFISVGVELRSDVCVDHSFQLVFEVEWLKIADHLHLDISFWFGRGLHRRIREPGIVQSLFGTDSVLGVLGQHPYHQLFGQFVALVPYRIYVTDGVLLKSRGFSLILSMISRSFLPLKGGDPESKI